MALYKNDSRLIELHDHEEFPPEPIREALRKFGDANGFKSATTIARALDIPSGTLNIILYGKDCKSVSGKTKRLIESAIRHFDPRTNPETLVNGVAVKRHFEAWMKRHDLNQVQAAKILGIPARTYRHWVGKNHPENYPAKNIRPHLIKTQDYTREVAARLVEIDRYNSNGGRTAIRPAPSIN